MKQLTECIWVLSLVFAALPASAGILDANYIPHYSQGSEEVSANLSDAQTFTVQNTGALSEVGVEIYGPYNNGVPLVTQPLTLQIRTLTGGLPSEANSGPTVLAFETIAPSAVLNAPTFVTIALPDISVTAGEQLAIVLSGSTTDNLFYAWQGNFDFGGGFFSSAGTYSGGQAYFEGPSAERSNGSGGYILGSTTWENLFLYYPIGSQSLGGGPNSDFGFEVFEAGTPEPAVWLLLLTALPAAAICKRRLLHNPMRYPQLKRESHL